MTCLVRNSACGMAKASHRGRWRAVLMLLWCTAAVACTAASEPPARRPVVRLAYGLTELANEYARAFPDWSFEVVSSEGGSLAAIQRGAADLALSSTDIAYMAFVGQLEPRIGPFDRIRGVAVLQLTPVHVMVRPGASITSIEQLRGKRVALGPSSTSTALIADLLLGAFGLSRQDLHGVSLPFMEAAARLTKGELDAAFVRAGQPAQSVLFATSRGARLLEIEGPPIAQLRTVHPFLKFARIPAGVYPSHGDPIRTVGVDAMLACRADLDEMLVYRLTKAFFHELPALSERLDSLRAVDLDRAPATPIPLHVGAARYYRVRELYP
jgi:TRAP transporter TAXI family solute receptor